MPIIVDEVVISVEAAAHRGLAGADVAGQQDEAAARAAHRAAGGRHAVQQVRQRLAVALAHEEVPRVRRDGERVLRQAEVVRVHGREHSAIARATSGTAPAASEEPSGSPGGPFLAKI